MKRFARLAFSISALIATAGASGSIYAACAPDSGVVIYYGNGMFISPARARVQALLMDQKLRPSLPSGTKVTFSYAYNPSEDDINQALQAAAQAATGTNVKVPSWLKVPSSAPTSFTNAVKNLEQSANPDNYVKDGDLTAHVALYTSKLSAGKRVIVVAHSQGNFYANKAYDRLSSHTGFAIVSVGTPATYTAGNGPYTTLTNDQIIGPVPNRRAPNTTNGAAFVKATKGSDGHSFTSQYLDGDVSGPQIVSQVNATLASLTCPVGKSAP